MVELKSISRPRASADALESGEVTAKARVRDGTPGSAPIGDNRAGKAYIVTGKSDVPLRRKTRTIGPFETVIGVDARERILETNDLPWRMIAALELHGPPGSGTAVGSAWLAGPRTLVTAGHCVHHMPFFGGWASRIEVSLGRNGSEFPYETLRATRYSSVDRWVNDADPDFDIGCIHLDNSIGDTTGWFAFGSPQAAELNSRMVNISGYPADRGDGTEQYHHANRVLNVGARRMFYDVDTFGGQSGSPVWIQGSAEDAPLVVGIHAYGTGGTPFDMGITANSAPRIIPEVFDQIVAWVEEDNAGA